ncbi:MAG: 3-hydroxyacyl-ACP dehydratase FabZ [Proteobacteria bacterium]|nr:3-hydroxyacyl-ACP dehydratase FabZ [Pseudomonadota bacterium]
MDARAEHTIIETFNLDRIKKLIPHRYPFLLIDKMHLLERGEAAIGIKNVTANEPYFQGHFPKKPVMPGVLIVEALAQTAAVLALDVLLTEEESALVYLAGLDNVKFRRQVVPGDVLELRVKKERARMAVWRLSGVAWVDGEIAAEASFSAVIEKVARVT